MPVERIDLGKGSYTNVDEISTQEGVSPLLQNGYLDDLGANHKIWGMSTWASFLLGGAVGGNVHGLFYSTTLAKLIAVWEGVVYSLDSDGNATEITGGTLTKGARVSFFEAPALTSSGTYAAQVFMANGGSVYYTDGTTLTKLSGTNAPSECGTVLFSDYQMLAQYDKRFFVHSEPNDLLNLGDSANLIAVDSSPDDLVGMCVLNREILCFGKRSIDTFYYSSLGSTATWVKTPGGFNSDHGCRSRSSIVEFANAVYFLNHRREVCRYAGRQVQVISTSISKELEALSTVSDAVADKIDYNGKHFYWITFPTENRTYVYDILMDCWYRMGKYNSSTGELGAHFTNCYAYDDDNNLYLAGTRDGRIRELKADNYDVDTDVDRFVRRTGYVNHGSDLRWKRCNRITFRVKSGQNPQPGTTTYSTWPEKNFMVRYRDEAGAWSNWLYPSLKPLGNYNFTAELRPLGRYRSRQWEIAQTDTVAFSIVSMEEDYDILR